MKTNMALKIILGSVCAACMIAIAFLTSIEVFTFNQSFYDREYRKYTIPESIEVSHYDLMLVTDRLLGYMRGNYEDLTVEVPVAGEKREFFNQREKDHMVDVRYLFDIGYTIRKIIIVLFLITVIAGFLIGGEVWSTYAKCLRNGIIIFILAIGSLVGLILSDFNKYFTIFHEIFFDNDLWVLNPQTDLLVNIVPLNFFIDIFTAIAALFSVLLVIMGLGSGFYVHHQKRRQNKTGGS